MHQGSGIWWGVAPGSCVSLFRRGRKINGTYRSETDANKCAMDAIVRALHFMLTTIAFRGDRPLACAPTARRWQTQRK
jgi:hypothetical protein